MKQKKSIIVAFLLIVAGLQTMWAQGFRVYKSDGTIAQFSLRTDSIVFYEGIGSDMDFGPFTPVNQCIVGTWYQSRTEPVTFSEDGTTDYINGATYKFLPYQGSLIIYNSSGAPIVILKVHDVSAEQMIISTLGNDEFQVWGSTSNSAPTRGVTDGHEWVDLGLPSGTLWATCNVGASTSKSWGYYFAWGETTTKDEYSYSTYKYCKGSYHTLTKYCIDSSCGYNGFTDGKIELESKDDAATANWGSNWQMPSKEQFQELGDPRYTYMYSPANIRGRLITSKINGNSIYLPPAGYMNDNGFGYYDETGYYWARSLNTSNNECAEGLFFESGMEYATYWGITRVWGCSVRPVRVKKE